MATPRAQTVTLERIADVFGVTTEGIRTWRKEGMPSRRVSGRPAFVIRECITWRREQDRLQAAVSVSPVEAKERARKLRAEADLKEDELRKRRGETVETAVVDEMADRIIGGFAAVAMGRLGRFEREMVKCTTAGEARRIVDRMKAALMEGARHYADEWEAEADALERDAAAPSVELVR